MISSGPEYTYQTQTDKLRSVALFHAAKATAINKLRPGWSCEAAFHWEVALDLICMANRVEAMDIETKELQRRKRNIKSGDMGMFENWGETKSKLLGGLASPSTEALLERLLESQRERMTSMYDKYTPQRELNAVRKDRIEKIRIKRNLVNRRRKALGLKPYRPKISVFQKKQKETDDLPMIRRVIPGCFAFDIPDSLSTPENTSHIFEMRINRNMDAS